MKLSKDELKEKINTLEISEELKVDLLEDIEDSVDITEEVDNTALDEMTKKYDELLQKYKERFLEKKEDTEDEEDEEVKEEEIIDVKEI